MYFESITAWIALRSAVGGRIHGPAPAVTGGQSVERDLAGEPARWQRPASYDGRAGHERDQRDAATAECCCCCRLSETDVQDEVPDPQVEYCATGPVHDERQEDDDDDDHHHPDEEHDNPGKGVPGYRSRSSHGRQLPGFAVLIPLRALAPPSVASRHPG